MTSFYDRTASVAAWCEQTRLPPADALMILRQRLSQVREYVYVVAPRLEWLDPADPHRCAKFAGAEWKDIRRFAAALGVETGGGGFWLVVFGTLDVVRAQGPTAEQLYDQMPIGFVETVWDLLCKPFGILHDVGHEIKSRSRYSDSPRPPARKRSAVRDSDAWLSSTYPAAPKY